MEIIAILAVLFIMGVLAALFIYICARLIISIIHAFTNNNSNTNNHSVVNVADYSNLSKQIFGKETNSFKQTTVKKSSVTDDSESPSNNEHLGKTQYELVELKMQQSLKNYNNAMALLLAISLIGISDSIGVFMYSLFIEDSLKPLWLVVMLLSLVLLGVAFYIRDIKTKVEAKYHRYISIIDFECGQFPISTIASVSSQSKQATMDDIQEMIDKRILDGAYIDYSNSMLVLDKNNHNIYQDVHEDTEENDDLLTEISILYDEATDNAIAKELDSIINYMNEIGAFIKTHSELEGTFSESRLMVIYLPKAIELVKQYNTISESDPSRHIMKDTLIDTLKNVNIAAKEEKERLIKIDNIDLSSGMNALNTKMYIDGLDDTKEKES